MINHDYNLPFHAVHQIFGASFQSAFCRSGWNGSKSTASSRFRYLSAGIYTHVPNQGEKPMNEDPYVGICVMKALTAAKNSGMTSFGTILPPLSFR